MDVLVGQHQPHYISISGVHSAHVPKWLCSYVSGHQARCQDEVIAKSRLDLFRSKPLEPEHDFLSLKLELLE